MLFFTISGRYMNYKNLIFSLLILIGVSGCDYASEVGTIDDLRARGQATLNGEIYKPGEDPIDPTYYDSNQRFTSGRSIDPLDKVTGQTRSDFIRDLYGRGSKFSDKNIKGYPSSSTTLYRATSDELIIPKIPNDKRLSISVTEDVPIKDVILQLAQSADLDIEIDPTIEGGVLLNIRKRRVSEILARIARQLNLVIRVENGTVKISKDKPYVLNYRMNLLNVERNSTSTVKTSTSISSSGEGSSVNTGSTSNLNQNSDGGNIWENVKEGLDNIILNYNPGAEAQDAPQQVQETSANNKGRSVGTNQVTSAVTGKPLESKVIAVNKHTGIISILANSKQHREIRDYLDFISISFNSQVLIEAKVVEVELDDRHRSGIDWNIGIGDRTTVDSSFGSFSGIGAAGQDFSIGVLPGSLFGASNLSIGAAIDLVEQFGATRTLSSPRISAMNNQHAILSFAENFVYTLLDVTESTDNDLNGIARTRFDVNSQIKSVPIGVILNIQPSIDLVRDEVMLSVRPTLTRITGTVTDPATQFILNTNENTDDIEPSSIPVVEVREIDTVMRVKNGEIMVIGGLMSERSNNVDRGIPGASRVPLLGRAFKTVEKDNQVVETVIFIKATIQKGQGVSIEDRSFYNDFFPTDRRPLQF